MSLHNKGSMLKNTKISKLKTSFILILASKLLVRHHQTFKKAVKYNHKAKVLAKWNSERMKIKI